MLPGQVRGHAVGSHIAPYLRVVLADPSVCPRARLASVLVTTHDALTSVISAPARVTRPILLDVTVREQAAGEVGPGEQRSDRDPGLFDQLDLHANLVSLLPHDPLQPGQKFAPG